MSVRWRIRGVHFTESTRALLATVDIVRILKVDLQIVFLLLRVHPHQVSWRGCFYTTQHISQPASSRSITPRLHSLALAASLWCCESNGWQGGMQLVMGPEHLWNEGCL